MNTLLVLLLVASFLQAGLCCECAVRFPADLASDFCRNPTMNVIKAKVGSENDWVHRIFNITVPAVIEKVWGLGEAKVGDVVEITSAREFPMFENLDLMFDYEDEDDFTGDDGFFVQKFLFQSYEWNKNFCHTPEMVEGESVMLWWNGSDKLKRVVCDLLYFKHATEDYVDSVSTNLNC